MQENSLIFYATPDGNIKVEVIFEDETFWLSQKRIAQLFEVDVRTVNEHLKNIFESKELEEDSVIRNFRITADDGKNYNTKFYRLEAIIAVGYRVNYAHATRFHIWATQTLKKLSGRKRTNEEIFQGLGSRMSLFFYFRRRVPKIIFKYAGKISRFCKSGFISNRCYRCLVIF